MTPSLSICVIVYNKDWDGSPTLRSLDAFGDAAKARIQLVIHDNSRISHLREAVQDARGFESVQLVHDGINHPLGRAYRRFMAQARGRHLIFLDDDTALTEAYVNEVESVLSSRGCTRHVCVPQIFDSNGRLYSPSKFGVFSGRLLPAIEPGAHSDLNAVMSGIALNESYLKELGPEAFSVESRLYGVDTMFMLAHGRLGKQTWVTRSVFRHSFSQDQRRSFRESVFRSWLEARGLFWTVVRYRRAWVPLLPLYLTYFMLVRVIRAARRLP